jgi:hypothetical protein
MLGVGRLRERLFGIPLVETRFDRRGFEVSSPRARERFEAIGATFVGGYHAALADDDLASVATRLDEIAAEFRGYAFEGAAMGLALLDLLVPWGARRWEAFVQGRGAAHTFMLHVGAGWAMARLPHRMQASLARMDPLLGWLAIDGVGFHDGYFHTRRTIDDQVIPDRIDGDARPVYDQGLGRSVWFARCADVERVECTVRLFPEARQPDLWSGIGLACAYAGGADRRGNLEALYRCAGEFRPHLAQGAAFAAKARLLAGNLVGHTEDACAVFCGTSAAAAAAVTDATLPLQRRGPGNEPYESWRRRIREHFDTERDTR